MFTPSSTLMNYLNEKPVDRVSVIAALASYITVDKKFETNDFEEAVKYALAHGISEDELYEEFNSEIEFVEDSSKWNEDYYFEAMVYLRDNFCQKRIEHIEAVAKKLYPKKAVSAAQQTNPKNAQSQQSTTTISPKVVAVAAAVAAAALLAIMILGQK